MLSTQPAYQAGVGFARLGHGIVATVKVLALLELVLQQVLLVGQLAVESEELLLFFRQLLDQATGRVSGVGGGSMGSREAHGDVNFVSLVGIEGHGGGCSFVVSMSKGREVWGRRWEERECVFVVRHASDFHCLT